MRNPARSRRKHPMLRTVGRGIQLIIERFIDRYPEVLQLYSPVFYNGGLEPVSRPCQDRLQGWDSSRVIAHHVVGREQQEAGSPSWFNWTEIRVVREYAESLISFGLPPSEIGVITPYVQQVQKLKQILH